MFGVSNRYTIIIAQVHIIGLEALNKRAIGKKYISLNDLYPPEAPIQIQIILQKCAFSTKIKLIRMFNSPEQQGHQS